MVASNMSQLNAMLTKELRKAMDVTSEKALADMYDETGKFYTGGNPSMYQRTGALGDTPRTTAVSMGGQTASFEAYLDQSHQYYTGDHPSMGQVLDLANYGKRWITKGGNPAKPTVGKKGFWERAEKKIGKTFERTLKKFFK